MIMISPGTRQTSDLTKIADISRVQASVRILTANSFMKSLIYPLPHLILKLLHLWQLQPVLDQCQYVSLRIYLHLM